MIFQLSAPLRQHAGHLAELGTLHVFVRRMVEGVPMVAAPPCLGALATAMKLQLNEFCKLISQLEAQVNNAFYFEHVINGICCILMSQDYRIRNFLSEHPMACFFFLYSYFILLEKRISNMLI